MHTYSTRFIGVLALCLGACDSSHSQDAALQDAGDSDAASTSEAAAGRQLATSATHSCVIRERELYCWGRNAQGELGDGTHEDSDVAVHAQAAGVDVVEVATQSGRTCVRRSTGEVACWGANDRGQIGDGTRDDALTGVAPSGIDDAQQLAVDDYTTCVVHGAERAVSCWGEARADAPDSGSLVPESIAGLSGIEQLQVGAFGSYCALDAEHSVKCWRMVDGAWSEPHEVDGLAGARAIAMPHADYVCAIVEAGAVVCEGIDSDVRSELPGSEGAVDVVSSSGGLVLCAPDMSEAWQCWNVPSFLLADMGQSDVAGQFALTVRSDVPVRELAVAGFRLCVLREDGSVACTYQPEVANLLSMELVASSPVEGLPD